ncbi:Bifunctional solanapyrone synthase [Drechslerella dactyloides]|uniref:Bifunctional solanapyrone synthase n=1 Tax=Drechslerella dactyloides TaxID=74499 RepID=A0AAD6J1B5_DREDA|nr:Bifunctional solanapyrone synthase [Drechslerella dactyloides]
MRNPSDSMKLLLDKNLCTALRWLDSSKVSWPNQSTYMAQNGNWNFLQAEYPYWSQQSVGSPSCVFSAKSIQDVAAAVKILHANKCEYAIRSGGHNPIPGWSNTNGGVLLSTSAINDVTVDTARRTVKFGAGCRWRDVYTKLDAMGLGTMGARDNTVGVGGFLLGGGINYYSNSNGWSADHVIEYEVVYADGTTGTISQASDPDLFTAMKGAGSSFAIVTHFTQEVFPQGAYNGGFVFYPDTSIKPLLAALYNYGTSGAIQDPKSHIIPAITSMGLDLGLTNVGTFCFFYPTAIPSAAEVPVFKPFTQDIYWTAATKRNRVGMNDVSGEIGGYSTPGRRQSFTDMAIVLDYPNILQELWDVYQAATAPYRLVIAGYSASLIFYPLTRTFVAKGRENGKKNSMGLEDSAAGQAGKTIMIVSINLTWLASAQDAAAAACVGKAFAAMEARARARNVYHPYKYMNYANGTQDVLGGYGTNSVNRLRSVKRRVDPTNDFGRLVKGRYRIPWF